MAADESTDARRLEDELGEGLDGGLDRQSGELLEKELGASSRARAPAGQELVKVGYDLDELARQGYVDGRFKSPVTKAVAKLYLTLKDEGAAKILEKSAKAFDEQITKH
jgi:hypothetical protein